MKRAIVVSCAVCLFATSTVVAQSYVGTELYSQSLSELGVYELGIYGGDVVGYDTIGVLANSRALIVKGPSGTVTNITPNLLPNFNTAQIHATDGVHQVGVGGYVPFLTEGGFFQHALLWTGTAESAVDLQPTILTGFDASAAYGVAGNQQVGELYVQYFGPHHAVLWTGSASTAVDLNPANLGGSIARATDGVQQVGYGANAPNANHAYVWSGTAESAVDLHPNLPGAKESYAAAVAHGEQAGYIQDIDASFTHAVLWHGTAASAIDLHPTNLGIAFSSSALSGTNGTLQVGGGNFTIGDVLYSHALLWKGAADTAVDLHPFLPPGFVDSTAYSIDAQGVIYGIAYDTDLQPHAVQWTPVPEPVAISLFAVGASLVFCLRKPSKYRCYAR